MRWHNLRNGRIVASVDAEDGDAAEAMLETRPSDLLVSDAMWRTTMYRKALMRQGRPKMGAEQWTHEMRRRANELSQELD